MCALYTHTKIVSSIHIIVLYRFTLFLFFVSCNKIVFMCQFCYYAIFVNIRVSTHRLITRYIGTHIIKHLHSPVSFVIYFNQTKFVMFIIVLFSFKQCNIMYHLLPVICYIYIPYLFVCNE